MLDRGDFIAKPIYVPITDCTPWKGIGFAPSKRAAQTFVEDVGRPSRYFQAPAAPATISIAAAPDLDGWAIVERLLADLGRLEERICLVLATRHDLRLGLYRLRLKGELTDIRAADLVAIYTMLFAAALSAVKLIQRSVVVARHASRHPFLVARRFWSPTQPGVETGLRT